MTEVHLEDQPIITANTALQAAINGGAYLVSYHGHSGYQAWGSNWFNAGAEKLFDAADAASLINVGKPTVVAQWGCWTTDFVNASTDVLSNTLLNSPQGAAAVMGSPALTDAIAWGGLSRQFMASMPGRTLGEAMVHARSTYAASLSPTRIEGLKGILLGWTLLGDPGQLTPMTTAVGR